MGAYLRNGRWMVFYHDESGKRRDKSFGSDPESQEQAELFDAAVKSSKKSGWTIPLADLLDSLSKSKPETVPLVKQNSNVTFEQLCNSYLDDLSISGRSKKHIAILRTIVANCYYKFMDKNKNAEQFTYLSDIAPFLMSINSISSQTGLQRSQATINRYGDYLDAIFNYGIRIGLVTHNPVKGRRKSKEIPRTVKLSIADIQKILEHFAIEHIHSFQTSLPHLMALWTQKPF